MSADPALPPVETDPFDPASLPGGRREIATSARAQLLRDGRMEALAEQVEPRGPTFTLVSDEPTDVGGLGSAPSAMQYYAASLAFCMMIHVRWCAETAQLHLDALKIQMTARFSISGSAQEGTVQSEPLGFDMRIEIEAADPSEDAVLVLQRAQRTCFTHRALISPVVVNATYAFNGQELLTPPDSESR